PNEDFARLGTVRRTENAGLVQLVDDAGGTTIPDPEFSLQERRRPELVLDAGVGRLAEELVALPRRSGPVPILAASLFLHFLRASPFQRVFFVRVDGDQSLRPNGLCLGRLPGF